jgi:hypothetical protein
MARPKNAAFSLEQEQFILFEFARTQSWTAVMRLFNQKFGIHRGSVDRRQFRRVHERFLKTGSTVPNAIPRPGRPVDATGDGGQNAVQQFFTVNPRASIRQCSRELDVSYGSVHRILKDKLKMKAYKISKVQVYIVVVVLVMHED